jgi:hypothetical protein
MMRSAFLILLFGALPLASRAAVFEAALPAGCQVWQPLVESSELGQEGRGVAFLAEALAQGAHALLPLPAGLSGYRDAEGRLSRECLSAIMQYQGPLYFPPQDQAALGRALARFPGLSLDALAEPAAPVPVVVLEGRPRIVLVENSSSIAPLSKALAPWGLQPRLVSFSEVERAPQGVLDPSQVDLVAFSSPGWWDDFANPPSGPSRMKDPVAKALRSFVAEGGNALFTDLAQWDLLRAWPGILKLSSLGPYKASSFKALGKLKGGKLALAPFGVAASWINPQAQPLTLLAQPKFSTGAGKPRKVLASYALIGPGGEGRGMVFGQALHPFEQDDEAAFTARRIFLNTLLATLASRGQLWDGRDLKPNAAATALPSPSQSPTSTRVFTKLPSATPSCSATSSRTPTFTSTATPIPSPTASLTPSSTPRPTQRITPRATAVPPTVGVRSSASFTATRTATVTPVLARAVARLPPTPRPAPLAKAPLVPPRPTSMAPPVKARRRASATPSATPVPTSRPLPADLKPGIPRNALGGLRSAPEPFGEGGVYLYFNLKAPAKMALRVYAASGGLALRELTSQGLMLGSSQVFYDGLDAAGKPLAIGLYYWVAEARFADGHAERRYATLTKH